MACLVASEAESSLAELASMLAAFALVAQHLQSSELQCSAASELDALGRPLWSVHTTPHAPHKPLRAGQSTVERPYNPFKRKSLWAAETDHTRHCGVPIRPIQTIHATTGC